MKKSKQLNVSWRVARLSQSEIGKSLARQGEKIICIGRLHYLVASKSDPGEWHCVDLEMVDGGEGGCTCRGFVTRKDCRHWRVVKDHLGI